MAFIETIPEDAAEGATADWYAAERDQDGYVSNSTKVFGHRPAVLAAWVQLGGTIGGAKPDPAFRALDPELREALTVGRPIAED